MEVRNIALVHINSTVDCDMISYFMFLFITEAFCA